MDERIPDFTVIVKCSRQAQKNTRILHVFKAEQWRKNYQVGKCNVQPLPPSRDLDWWQNHYRLRLDGRWLTDSKTKYRFYSARELLEVFSSVGGLQP